MTYRGDQEIWSVSRADCSQPLYLAHAKGNPSEANTKHAEVEGGGGGVGWGLLTKRARTNREAADIFGKKLTY